MSRRSMAHAVLAAAGLLGLSATCGATNPDAIRIDVSALHAKGCFGQSDCELDGINISTSSGALSKKLHNGATGFGVSGGPSGNEIDIGETLSIDIGQSRRILAIKILFLYNGPEFGDRAEIAKVFADGTPYTLSTRNNADDASAVWSGPGTVKKCGATTSTGTGCFIITDPFPEAVGSLGFTAVPGGQPFPAHKGPGSSNSDYAIGFVDVEAQVVINLQDCAGVEGCPVVSVNGKVAFSFNSMQSSNAGGSLDTIVIPVRLPDCRYIPHVCLTLLPPTGATAASENDARALLIGLGVIKSLDPSGPNRLNPAVQLLNVTPLLPTEVTSLFDTSGAPPNGLPPLYIASRWRGQLLNGHWFDGYFFKTDPGVVFSDVFEGLIDVFALTGRELGCEADPNDLLAWDVITTASELARSVGGRHGDRMINVGCINPTKVSGERLSLYSINLEPVHTTHGPTIKSSTPKITVNNDAVFARLVQSLWKDLGEVRANFVCKQADPVPVGGVAPLSTSVCKKLASLWAIADFKINLCVNAAFYPASSYSSWICGLARKYINDFEAALPVEPTGPDDFNRVAEVRARLAVVEHVWEERFLKSIKPNGYCRERGTCPL